jgi:ABC-type sugar transport system permease subunit
MASNLAGRVSPVSAGTRRELKATAVGWLIGPALLLFALFFLLPLGVLGVMAFLSGNPVNAPAVHFTLRHFERFFGDDLYPEALWAVFSPPWLRCSWVTRSRT